MSLSEDVRHERERGMIIEVLIENRLQFTPLHIVLSMLEAQGFALGDGDAKSALRALDFHLTYLADHQLVERKSLREGSIRLEVQVVRATGKAVDLRDERLTPIPGVRF